MEVFDIVSQLTSLRELKLSENDLQGELSSAICDLTALEVLEVQANKITGIPSELGMLSRLRSLNVVDNQLRTIPADLFQSSSLIELQVSKNRLEGTLFSVDVVPYLQELHASNNSLLLLCDNSSVQMPALRTLNISTNRLTSFPDVSSWTTLTTLLIGENKLTALPEGFVGLADLRTADFTGNDLTQIDERIALMGSLEHLILAVNPLRERKFLTMNTEDIKRDLASRLPAEDRLKNDDDNANCEFGFTEDTAISKWQPLPSGMLDLSDQAMAEIEERSLEPFAEDIRQLVLHQNVFQSIPATLSQLNHLTLLDLSKNAIETPLTSPLNLPKLRDLRLTNNKLKSLDPLITHLTAPALQTLDISQNRITGALPLLRTFFPVLITLLAADNGISDVSADSLTGLRIVNLSNNDMERLEPRIGLLQGTLTAFEVEGNKFRVPNWQVLRKGTDAVLAWLRDKIPRESWRSDVTEFFDADEGETVF